MLLVERGALHGGASARRAARHMPRGWRFLGVLRGARAELLGWGATRRHRHQRGSALSQAMAQTGAVREAPGGAPRQVARTHWRAGIPASPRRRAEGMHQPSVHTRSSEAVPRVVATCVREVAAARAEPPPETWKPNPKKLEQNRCVSLASVARRCHTRPAPATAPPPRPAPHLAADHTGAALHRHARACTRARRHRQRRIESHRP